MLLLLAACEAPTVERQILPGASAERGREVIETLGCGACHVIPGVKWPKGRVGPSLEGFGDRALIAGRLPNRPDVLAAFIRNAPALAPGTGMPPIAMTEGEARDAAAYLVTLGAR